jgi:hypothetical protein
MERYEALRRENSAVRLCFMLAVYALQIDLPDEVFEDAAFNTIYFAACDLVWWANVSRLRLNSFGLATDCLLLGFVQLQHGTIQGPPRQQCSHRLDAGEKNFSSTGR